jgi:ATP-dependent DNA ligase
MFAKDCLVPPEVETANPLADVDGRTAHGLSAWSLSRGIGRAFIDGEAVVLRREGHSDFGALPTKRGGAQASFAVFGLLRFNADYLRMRPLDARLETLMRLVANVGGILFSDALAA